MGSSFLLALMMSSVEEGVKKILRKGPKFWLTVYLLSTGLWTPTKVLKGIRGVDRQDQRWGQVVHQRAPGCPLMHQLGLHLCYSHLTRFQNFCYHWVQLHYSSPCFSMMSWPWYMAPWSWGRWCWWHLLPRARTLTPVWQSLGEIFHLWNYNYKYTLGD